MIRPPPRSPLFPSTPLSRPPPALCCMHRGALPLHAAAVEIESRAVVIAAPGRHGKTTLALAFQRHGYRVLTEDLACCSLASTPKLLPGPALLRVRPDVYHGHPPAGDRKSVV